MELRRFYVKDKDIIDGKVFIKGDEHLHMSTVLRFRVGYKLIVCDNSGLDYYCTVVKITSTCTECTVDEVLKNETEHETRLILLCGLIKPDKLEIAIQKAVELGANKIVPFYSKNTVEKGVRLERLNRIALEACKQCGRAILPEILEPLSFEQALERGEGLKIIAYEKEKDVTFKSILEKRNTNEPITLVVGSEGGFIPEEVQKAVEMGYVSVTLGKRILRAETASIAGLSNISLFLED